MSDQRIGTEIGGYRIESVLGRGGMGVVYLAQQAAPKRKIALKLLTRDLAADPTFRERFIRESDAAASIEHPNIIPIHQAGEEDGELFIAMRYVEGTDLGTLLQREGPLSPQRTVSIVSQVAQALDAAHEVGLVHRDVKPSNILVGKGDHAYLTDFGLIKRREHATSLTRTGQFMGTLDYVAPEQIRGRAVNGRADVYSLGCVLYECLTGEQPFQSDLEVTVLYAHLEEPPPSVTAHRPDLPAAIDDVVAKAMAKKPEDRYESAGELTDALREAMEAPAEPLPAMHPKSRHRRPLFAGIFATAAVVVILLVLFLLSRHPAPSPGVPPTSPRASAPLPPPLGSVIQLDPGTGSIVTTVRNAIVAHAANAPRIAVGEGGVWARTHGGFGTGEAIVSHIDVRTGRLENRFQPMPWTAGSAPGLAIGAQTVWVPSGNGVDVPTSLVPIDPATDQPLAPIRLGLGKAVTDVQVGAGGVWVTLSSGVLVEVDPRTRQIARTIDVGGHLDALTIGFGSVWVVDEVAGKVSRVDPETEAMIKNVDVGVDVRGILAGAGAVWVLDPFSGTVAAIDPTTNAIGSGIRIGDRPTGMAAGLGAVWVSDGGGSVWRVDPVTRSSSEITVGAPLTAIAFDPEAGTLWLCVGGGPG